MAVFQRFGLWYNTESPGKSFRSQDEALNASPAYAAETDQLKEYFGGQIPVSRALGADIMAGTAYGKKEFYEDPIMNELASKYKDLSKGYEGETLGALRQLARGEIAGREASNLAALRSTQAKSGVGGARAAAQSAAIRQQGAQGVADAERKMMLDQANEMRKGFGDYADYEMKRKYGAMGTGAGIAQIGASERGANAQRAAAKGGGKK